MKYSKSQSLRKSGRLFHFADSKGEKMEQVAIPS